MARRRSHMRGMNRLRRVLRRVEPEQRRELTGAIEDIAKAIEADIIAGAPIRTGDLADSITYKLGRDKLTAVIGPGAQHVQITKSAFAQATMRMSRAKSHSLFQFFKAWWHIHGTVKQDASPIHWIDAAYDVNREWGIRKVRKGITVALQRASQGGGSNE